MAQRQHARGARSRPRSSAGSGSRRTISSRRRARREVVLSRAEKDAQGNPTVPCRWLVRLQALLESMGDRARRRDATGGAWARALDDVPTARPEPRPAPATARVPPGPRELSVSDIGLWMTDPYDLYAKRILRPERARGPRGRPGAARARHRDPPCAGAFRPRLSRRAARRRRAASARSWPPAVRGLQPPAPGHGAVVAALRADRRAG